MKVKLGDLTARQMKEICEKYKMCNDGCPLFVGMGSGKKCAIASEPWEYQEPWAYNTETEIDLPDEGNKKGEICPYPNCHYKNDHDRCLGCENAYK